MERKEAYEQIKKLGLQEKCKAQFGKNFTQCKTNELEYIIDNFNKNKVKAVTEVATEVKPVKATTKATAKTEEPNNSFYKLLAILRKRHILLESDVKEILLG